MGSGEQELMDLKFLEVEALRRDRAKLIAAVLAIRELSTEPGVRNLLLDISTGSWEQYDGLKIHMESKLNGNQVKGAEA